MTKYSINWRSYGLILLSLVLIISLSTGYATRQDEPDSDNDGLPDAWEDEHGLDPKNASDAEADPDNDGLNNTQEYENGTDPNDPDSDDGGVDDGTEANQSYNPNDKSDDESIDSDSDGMPDTWELENSFDPDDPSDADNDSDKDGYSNRMEYDQATDPNDYYDPKHIPADGDGGDGDEAEEDKDKKEKTGTFMGDEAGPLLIIMFIVIPIVILLVIIFVYTKMKREQLLEHKVRNDIFKYINRNPGIHYRGIMNELDLQMGVLTHHLNMLEQEKYIKSAQDGMYRRFYPVDAQIKSGLVLSDVQERILRIIQRTPGISQAEIGRNLGLSRKVVYYHVKILSDAGFVHTESAGRESMCYYLDGLEFDTPPATPGNKAG